MMWLEALISSVLLIAAFSMAYESEKIQGANSLANFFQYLSLADMSALAVEKNISPQECAQLFSENPNFCYVCAWSESQISPNFSGAAFSSENCAAKFNAPPPVLSVSRGAWREGKPQFLFISQFEK